MATTNRGMSKVKNGSSLSGVLDGAEALIAATAELGETNLEGLRETLQSDLAMARKQLEKLEGKLMDRANSIDDYVHENPWQAIGGAAAVSVAVGVVIGAVAFRR